MPLSPPRLDDRTFEELVREVRRRIPTFTPEWTNHNESDPGITLAQLFAFMTEHLLFQLDQVPDKGLVTFLRMVGAELHPATPALADVTFSNLVMEGGVRPPFVPIDAGTEVRTASPPPGEKVPIRFETAEAFAYLRGELQNVISINCEGDLRAYPASRRSITSPFRPFGAARSLADEFYLVFELDDDGTLPLGPWPAGTFSLRVNVAGSTDVGDPAPIPRAAPLAPRIQWSYASGFRTVSAGTIVEFTDFEPAHDSTDEFTRSGYLRFRFDADDILQRAPVDVDPTEFADRFVLRARIARTDAYGADPPQLATVRLNTVPAHHLTSADDELVGSSTGLPFQRFRLAHAPVAVGSVRVEVTAPGGTVETFEEVPDLFAAGPGDKVFALLPATGEILFGSRTFGAIPPPDDSGVGGNIRASYQHGGGRRGNVGAGALSQVASPAGVGQLDGTNLLPALGGDDEETAAEGVVRAPAVVRSRYRPVSESDFSALARETPNVRVARALTLPNSRPGLVPGTSPGAVTVVLVPNAPFAETLRKPIPLPSHVASAVLRYLDGRRLVTTQVFVREAEFRQITVDTTLTVEAGSGLLDARTAATDTLLRHFHPLVGGRTGDGWPFGGTAEHSTIFERLLRTEGVARVEELKIRLDDGPWLECEDVPVGAGELLYSGEHIVRIAGAG